ncbi:MAG: cupin domain-containing protein [Pseudomonas sp.]|uniref:cupin domain-containing protein n=1 Tax=Pseudomonas abieticivorans TaxID=2931382 RepID=UPI0020BF3F9D|nr:cupin domain-containing protein [Pseudomonas sp. PIA16]MDE1166358.1 cupin domain-containing protein [Pseudomonas sp.]
MNPLKLMTCLLVLGASLSAHAHEAGHENVQVLQEKPLVNAPGKVATMLTVDYAPGQASAAHRHPGSVMAYVLQGTVVSQLKGEAAVTYKTGQYWYEPAGAVHVVSRNASKTKPAKLLVWVLKDEGQAVLEPMKE